MPRKVELPIKDLMDCFIDQLSLARHAWKESFCAGRDDAGVCAGDAVRILCATRKQILLERNRIVRISESCTENNIAFYSDVSKYTKDFIIPVMLLY